MTPWPLLTPTSIKFNRFLKLIVLEHTPFLACFGFMTSQKWLVSGEINLRKRLNLIDVGAELGVSAHCESTKPQQRGTWRWTHQILNTKQKPECSTQMHGPSNLTCRSQQKAESRTLPEPFPQIPCTLHPRERVLY